MARFPRYLDSGDLFLSLLLILGKGLLAVHRRGSQALHLFADVANIVRGADEDDFMSRRTSYVEDDGKRHCLVLRACRVFALNHDTTGLDILWLRRGITW